MRVPASARSRSQPPARHQADRLRWGANVYSLSPNSDRLNREIRWKAASGDPVGRAPQANPASPLVLRSSRAAPGVYLRGRPSRRHQHSRNALSDPARYGVALQASLRQSVPVRRPFPLQPDRGGPLDHESRRSRSEGSAILRSNRP